jgi:F0F1-type ATP synthase assembly protein I
MTKMLVFLVATIGSAIGWWLGAFIGTMSAFFLSVVGMAAGVYVARRLAAEYAG